MFEKFLNKKVDYFWEYKYPFGVYFIKELFTNEYKRKYSLEGNGIYDLLYTDKGIYELKFSKTLKMLVEDNELTRDVKKNEILKIIKQNLPDSTSSKGKYITFKLGDFIGKIEIIKKIKEPN